MRWWLWAGLAVLFAAAAGSVYFAFQSPTFVAGLTAFATAAAWKAIQPAITKPLTPDDLEARQKAYRSGNDDWLRKRNGSLKD